VVGLTPRTWKTESFAKLRIAPRSRGVYGWLVNDDVIDLTKYLARTPPDSEQEGARGNFSVWGGEGERSRFALPIWRSIYLVGGGRGGLVSLRDGEDAEPEPLFVLDLSSEPARTDFELPEMRSDIGGDAPKLLEDGDVVAVFLGAKKGKSWFLVVDDRGEASEPVTAGTREDLLFLAGECAGLLFFRELAEAGEELDLD
jgi:hypothetical protein